LAASTALAGVDPGLLNLVMPDAKVLTGVQVDQAQSSPFGQYILAQIQPNQDFNKLIAATGFDPRHDLHEIVAASGDAQSGLAVGRGVFQPARIAAAAVLAGAVSSNYKGIEVLTGKGSHEDGSIAFLDTTTVVLGQDAAVKATIDRRLAGNRF